MSTSFDESRLSATRSVPMPDAVDEQIEAIKRNLEAIKGVASVIVSSRQNAPDCKAKPARITESPRGDGVAIAVFCKGCIVSIRVFLKDQKQAATMVDAIQRQWSRISSQSTNTPPALAEQKPATAAQATVATDREPNSQIENWLRLRPYVQRISVTSNYGASLPAGTGYIVQLSASKMSADVTIRIGRAIRCFRIEPKASQLSGISSEAKAERLVEELNDDLRKQYPRLSGTGASSEAASKKIDLSQRPQSDVRQLQPTPAKDESHPEESSTKVVSEQEVFVPSWVRPQKRAWYLFVASLGNGMQKFTVDRLTGRLREFLLRQGMLPKKAGENSSNFVHLLKTKNVAVSHSRRGEHTSLFVVTLPIFEKGRGDVMKFGQLALRHDQEPAPSSPTHEGDWLKNGGTAKDETVVSVSEPGSLNEGTADGHDVANALPSYDDTMHVNGSSAVEEVVYNSHAPQEGVSESVDQHEPVQEADAQALPALFADNADSVITTLSLEQMQTLTIEELVGMLDRISCILRRRGYVPRLTSEGVLTLTYHTVEK